MHNKYVEVHYTTPLLHALKIFYKMFPRITLHLYFCHQRHITAHATLCSKIVFYKQPLGEDCMVTKTSFLENDLNVTSTQNKQMQQKEKLFKRSTIKQHISLLTRNTNLR